MNREIKFRAWNGAEMVYDVIAGKFGVFYVNPTNNGIDERDSACLTPFNTKYSDETPVMQFTGLLDKDGKEIYEGDILREYSVHPDEKPRVIQIIWKDGGFMYRNSHNSDFYTYQHHCNNCEVIGNIYETPELLNS